MPLNGSGVYTPPAASFPAVANTLIESAKYNAVENDVATAISTAIMKDGQTTITANIPFAGFRPTGLGAGSAAGHSLRYEQLFVATEVTLLGALGFKKGADVASATTTDLSTATGNLLHITGTTAITAVTLTTGQMRMVIFDGILTLTHHTTNNNLPSAANITTAAGDRAMYWSDGTTVYCTYYQKANGTAVVASSASASKNYAINGSFAVNQDVTPTTTDNTYPFDGVRILLAAANAATISQDTADVPTGAGYAAKMVVGSGNNNKFGIFGPIENKDILDARGGVMSIRIPMKATAGLTDGTGKIRAAICVWTGAADAITGDPVSAWNAEGTNPTLSAGWAYANTPAAISVTTAWADYLIENASISASATNLAWMVWSDDTTNTQTTDILRVGGYVTMTLGAAASAAMVAPFDAELRKCQRYYYKSFAQATAPAQNVGNGTGEWRWSSVNASVTFGTTITWPVTMLKAPTLTVYNPAAANAQARNQTNAVDCTSTSVASNVTPTGVQAVATDAGGGSQGASIGLHIIAVARL